VLLPISLLELKNLCEQVFQQSGEDNNQIFNNSSYYVQSVKNALFDVYSATKLTKSTPGAEALAGITGVDLDRAIVVD
jgi:hypothetical protein